MDFLAHACYGATLCSRTGLAGGRSGPVDAAGKRLAFDWTVWAAFGFSILPDALSIGIYFLNSALTGQTPGFHRPIPGYVFTLYHFTHSLVIALAMSGLIRLVARPLFIPSLGWPLHILFDLVTHGQGRFQTLIFYPLSNATFPGLNWWMHPEVIYVYWGLLPLIWVGIHFWRKGALARRPQEDQT